MRPALDDRSHDSPGAGGPLSTSLEDLTVGPAVVGVERGEVVVHRCLFVGGFSSPKARTWATIAGSVGSRSTLLAPKKPAIPRVFRKTSATSDGSAIGPPWQRTITSS